MQRFKKINAIIYVLILSLIFCFSLLNPVLAAKHKKSGKYFSAAENNKARKIAVHRSLSIKNTALNSRQLAFCTSAKSASSYISDLCRYRKNSNMALNIEKPMYAGKIEKRLKSRKVLNKRIAAAPQVKISGKTPSGKSVVLTSPKVQGVNVKLLSINLSNKNVLITSAFSPGYSEIDGIYPKATLGRISRLYQPAAVINGTFFDSHSMCTVCNVVVDGKLICEGDRGSTLYIDKNNKAGMILSSRLRGRNINWSKCRWAIQSGPTLLYNGRVVLNPREEGFTDSSLFRLTRRTAAGITADGKIFLAATPGNISLHKMAIVMKSLGAVHAVNLDGGSSTGILYKGKYVIKPKRSLANFIMVYENTADCRLPEYPCINSLSANRDAEIAAKYRQRADALLAKGKLSPALNYYVKACRMMPSDIEFIMATAKTLEGAGRTKLSSRYYGMASITALDTGDRESAERCAMKALDYDSSNDYAGETLNIIKNFPEYVWITRYMAEKDYDSAYKLTQALIKKDNTQPRFYFALARISSAMNRYDIKANAFYMSAINFNKKYGREYEAYLAAKHAVETDPANSNYRLLLSDTAGNIGDRKAAKYHRFVAGQLIKDERAGKAVKFLTDSECEQKPGKPEESQEAKTGVGHSFSSASNLFLYNNVIPFNP